MQKNRVFPARLGYEAAGTVEAVGAGVRGFRPGDVVSRIPAFSQKGSGVYGELALVPANAVVKHPALFRGRRLPPSGCSSPRLMGP